MKYVKSYNNFVTESTVTVNVNGSQMDCYATDWEKGNLCYISIVNTDSSGWKLKMLALLHGLERSEMIKYNNEVQVLMLRSATERDNYIFYICKDETEQSDFATQRWKELANQEPTGAILKPDSSISIDEFKSIVKTHFPFLFYTNSTDGL